jgi:preprotein translocase subunit YajC
MFISEALAQAAGDASAGGGMAGLMQLAPLLLIFVVFYFLLIRPQQKKVKQHQAMTQALKRGDKVVTSGGILGVITKAVDGDGELEVEIAQGVKVRMLRSAVSDIATRMPDSRADKAADKAAAGKPGSKEGANDA